MSLGNTRRRSADAILREVKTHALDGSYAGPHPTPTRPLAAKSPYPSPASGRRKAAPATPSPAGGRRMRRLASLLASRSLDEGSSSPSAPAPSRAPARGRAAGRRRSFRALWSSAGQVAGLAPHFLDQQRVGGAADADHQRGPPLEHRAGEADAVAFDRPAPRRRRPRRSGARRRARDRGAARALPAVRRGQRAAGRPPPAPPARPRARSRRVAFTAPPRAGPPRGTRRSAAAPSSLTSPRGIAGMLPMPWRAATTT